MCVHDLPEGPLLDRLPGEGGLQQLAAVLGQQPRPPRHHLADQPAQLRRVQPADQQLHQLDIVEGEVGTADMQLADEKHDAVDPGLHHGEVSDQEAGGAGGRVQGAAEVLVHGGGGGRQHACAVEQQLGGEQGRVALEHGEQLGVQNSAPRIKYDIKQVLLFMYCTQISPFISKV